ncbi:MAG: VWA domain-containing protein, partial [Acidobacteria bacterium]|nr:VWA domain-containing protein [Acidobacteriota bacterium]
MSPKMPSSEHGTGIRAMGTEWLLSRVLLVALVSISLLLPSIRLEAAETLSRRERKERIAALAETYRVFLEEVAPIISTAEGDVFLKMESNPQRDRFIDEFWRRRDPDPQTSRNEYRDEYYARRETVAERYRSVNTDRGRIYLLRGEPARIATVEHCIYLRPVEVWLYSGDGEELLLFFKPGVSYVLWQGSRHSSASSWPGGGHGALEELLNPTGLSVGVEKVFFDHMEDRRLMPALLKVRCTDGAIVLEAIHSTTSRRGDVHRVFTPPEIDDEDVRRMLETSVVSDPDAASIDLESEVGFGEVRGSRVLVRVISGVSTASLKPIRIGEREFYQLNVVGETLQEGRMFERWEYRFDFPGDAAAGKLPVIIERPLRQGKWELRMKVMNPESGAEAVVSHVVDVPSPRTVPETAEKAPTEQFTQESRSVIRLLPPDKSILTGLQSFVAIPAGKDVAGVEFYLDGTKIMRKMQPPFSLELDLGPVPRPHTVRAVALNRRREPLDEDVLRLNDGADPFRVRIVSPRIGRDVTGAVRVEMEPQIPADATLAGLELFLNDDRVATLFGEPWMHTVILPDEPRLAVLRAVATLEDESVRPVEDVVILNGPENLERVDVRLIEVPTTVFSDGHPVQHLSQEAFEIFDSGEPVELAKFERLSNQPLSIGIAIDGSASMKDRLDGARNAVSTFLENVLTPQDRAFLVSFDRRVFILADWTSDPGEITESLASLRA